MNTPHAFGIETLRNPGMTGERWQLDDEMGTWPDWDSANDERTAWIESGYVPEQVRVVAIVVVDQPPVEEEEEKEDGEGRSEDGRGGSEEEGTG